MWTLPARHLPTLENIEVRLRVEFWRLFQCLWLRFLPLAALLRRIRAVTTADFNEYSFQYCAMRCSSIHVHRCQYSISIQTSFCSKSLRVVWCVTVVGCVPCVSDNRDCAQCDTLQRYLFALFYCIVLLYVTMYTSSLHTLMSNCLVLTYFHFCLSWTDPTTYNDSACCCHCTLCSVASGCFTSTFARIPSTNLSSLLLVPVSSSCMLS